MDFNNIDINTLDIILFICIIISMIIGYIRGFITETFSVFNWLFSGWFAFKYYSDLKLIVREYISHNIIADVLSFGTLFLLIIIFITIISNFISKNIKNSFLAPIDKILGSIFGIIRALILIIILIIASNQTIWVNNSAPSWLIKSNSYPIIILCINYIHKLLPTELIPFDYNVIDIEKLDLNTVIDKNKLFTEPPIKIEDKNEGSYTPAEREQMDRLNNMETIDTENSN
jgi:membrane protein required for colicin V production